MRKPTVKGGTLGWLLLAAFVTLWDIFAEETLSTSFWRAIQDPKKRWPVVVLWIYITLHLFHGIPDRYDPLRRLDRLAGGGNG